MVFESLALKMSRKKVFQTDLSESPLARVLTFFDLTALGVGSTLGLGVYVLSGSVSKEEAGPGIALSFVIAAIASLFAGLSVNYYIMKRRVWDKQLDRLIDKNKGLCYAEFGARVPRAGSAYIYSYVTVGEFIAFVIGWNLILEYVIGSASVVRGLTGYIDSLANNTIKHAFENVMPIKVDFLSPYPDFFAFSLTILFSVALALGVKESSRMNNIFTVLNMAVVIFVIITGAIKADPNNWNIKKEDIPSTVENGGEGGFLPFGFLGLIKGAATCFYGFVGFDCIATTGEEAINPQRNIPLSIIISLTIIFVSYFGISSVLTMMIPYFDQDTAAPLAVAFDKVGWGFARWTVSIGAIFGLTASFMGALFPLPRIVYAMSTDGLLFKFMGKINPRFKTPITGTLLSGTLTALMALIFNLDQLVSMMSIGTLLAYSMVAACVMLLRYQPVIDETEGEGKSDTQDKTGEQVTFMNVLSQILNLKKLRKPTKLTSTIASYLTALYFVFCIAAMAIVVQAADEISSVNPGAIFGLALFCLLLIFSAIAISLQPTANEKLSFTVPFVPWLPSVSILINIYLMMMLDRDTWIRFAVWLFIGLVIYFSYGIHNSTGAGTKTKKSVENGTDNHGYVMDDKL